MCGVMDYSKSIRNAGCRLKAEEKRKLFGRNNSLWGGQVQGASTLFFRINWRPVAYFPQPNCPNMEGAINGEGMAIAIMHQ